MKRLSRYARIFSFARPMHWICKGRQLALEARVDKAEGALHKALEEARRANDDGKVAVVEIITRQDTRFSWYNDLLAPA